jgi:hypothetical protein
MLGCTVPQQKPFHQEGMTSYQMNKDLMQCQLMEDSNVNGRGLQNNPFYHSNIANECMASLGYTR